ncbi:MAG TPA: tolB protein precursor protein, partial [Myxococcaceae bacterium]|nr:tolB protein precursor protein [Myxococcaceae bacterium]
MSIPPVRHPRLAALCIALITATPAWAQVFVYPRRPNKSQVRNYRFDWKHVDVPIHSPADAATEPPPEGAPALFGGSAWDRSGGIRLYFYESERPIAERALAQVLDAYGSLARDFNFVPPEQFPYILYSSYPEFLQTNLFPLQEGVLGVTSPRDLKLTLPYLGDPRLFAEVSTHEMAHQFTIQKVRAVAKAQNTYGDPLDALPLWFIEGLAEFYAQRGVDAEARMLVRDLLVNPDVENGYALLPFFEDRQYSFLWTYKVGQIRCAFLEEVYGAGTLQKILERSGTMVGVGGQRSRVSFPDFLEALTGDDPSKLSRKFSSWLSRGEYRAFLESEQDASNLSLSPQALDGAANALATSPDGNLILYRTLGLDDGKSSLRLFDQRDPGNEVTVAVDGVPGAESLHPISGRTFDVRGDALAYVAESNGRDVLYLQTVRSKVTPREASLEPVWVGDGQAPVRKESPMEADINLGGRRALKLGRRGLLSAFSPSFSPDGKRLALVGLDESGQRDLYLVEPQGGDFALTRLTRDAAGERHVSWGPEGIVFTSDATEHGKYNLFRIQPTSGALPERLTAEDRDHQDPRALPDGRVFFTAFDEARADLYEARDGLAIRHTSIATGLFDAGAGPNGDLWALLHDQGRRKLARVPAAELRSLSRQEQDAGQAPRLFPSRPLPSAISYDPFSIRNWELGSPFILVGAGAGGIYGQAFASATDRLRNHVLLLNASVFGSFELTDGFLLYVNQERRVTWGGGPFQALRFRFDRSVEDVSEPIPTIERFFGLLGTVRHPFNRFTFMEGELDVGGVSYFLFSQDRAFLSDPALNGSDQNLLPFWQAANGGLRFQTEVALRFGY